MHIVIKNVGADYVDNNVHHAIQWSDYRSYELRTWIVDKKVTFDWDLKTIKSMRVEKQYAHIKELQVELCSYEPERRLYPITGYPAMQSWLAKREAYLAKLLLEAQPILAVQQEAAAKVEAQSSIAAVKVASKAAAKATAASEVAEANKIAGQKAEAIAQEMISIKGEIEQLKTKMTLLEKSGLTSMTYAERKRFERLEEGQIQSQTKLEQVVASDSISPQEVAVAKIEYESEVEKLRVTFAVYENQFNTRRAEAKTEIEQLKAILDLCEKRLAQLPEDKTIDIKGDIKTLKAKILEREAQSYKTVTDVKTRCELFEKNVAAYAKKMTLLISKKNEQQELADETAGSAEVHQNTHHSVKLTKVLSHTHFGSSGKLVPETNAQSLDYTGGPLF